MKDEQNIRWALNEWYQTSGKQAQCQDVGTKKEYTREQQLFDAVLFEAEYGDETRKPFYFAMLERMIQRMRQ